MILKTVLTAMAFILLAFSTAIAWDAGNFNTYEEGRRDGAASERDHQAADQMLKERDSRKRQEESDRKQRSIQEEKETQMQDARRTQAYKESKAAHRAKVKKMRKAAGSKPFNSWQLNH